MMIILLISTSLLGTLIGYHINNRRLLNPLTFFCVFIGITHFLASLRLFGLINIDDILYEMAIIGMIGSVIGTIITKIKLKIKKIRIKSLSMSDKQKLTTFKSIIILQFIYEVYNFFNISSILLSGQDINIIRGIYYGQTIDGITTYSGILSTYYFQAMTVLFIPVFAYTLYLGNKSVLNLKYKIILGITFVLNLFNSGGGRMNLIVFLFSMVIIIVLKKRNSHTKLNRKTKVIISICFAMVISLVLYVSLLRQSGDLNVFKSLYYYFVGGIPNTGIHLKIFAGNYTNGFVFFSSLLRPLFLFLEYFFNYNNELYDIAINIPMVLGTTITDVGNGPFNSFATVFYYFFYDAGIIGVFLYSLLYIGFSQLIYNKYVKIPSDRNLILLVLIFISLYYSTIRYSYIYIYNFLAIVYWYLIFQYCDVQLSIKQSCKKEIGEEINSGKQ